MTHELGMAEVETLLRQHPHVVSTVTSALALTWVLSCVWLWRAWRQRSTPLESCASQMKRRAWPGHDVSRVFLPLVALNLLAFFTSLVIRGFGLSEDAFVLISMLFGAALVHGGALLLVTRVARQQGWSLMLALGVRREGAGRQVAEGVAASIAVLPIVVAGMHISSSFLIRLGLPVQLQPIVGTLLTSESWWLRLVLGSMAIGLAPLTEEVLFRGVALPFLAHRFGTAKGIAVVALVFALVHFNLFSVIPITLLATGLGVVYVMTGSLLTTISMHATFNAFSLLSILLFRALSPG